MQQLQFLFIGLSIAVFIYAFIRIVVRGIAQSWYEVKEEKQNKENNNGKVV